jgi:signal transduction histidine kinase
MIVILCSIGVIKQVVEIEAVKNSNFSVVFEEDYFHSESYIRESTNIIDNLTRLIGEFKNEEHILAGGTINEGELRVKEGELYADYQFNSKSYNPQLSEGENYEKFKQEYADKIALARDKLIKNDLREYHSILEALKEYKNPLYYVNDGVNVYTNTKSIEKGQFKSNPSYLLFEEYNSEFYPKAIEENEKLFWITERMDQLNPENMVVYIAFTDDYLAGKINEWQENKATITKSLYTLGGFLAGLILSFLYLVMVIGRKSFKDEVLHLNAVDKLYNDLNIALCITVISFWIISIDELFEIIDKVFIPITIPFATVVLVLILSLVKHFKNRTFLKHTLIYSIFYKLFDFVSDVYNNGSIAVKTVLIVIGYPILVAVTFFIFPITLGFAAWLVLKRIKSFNSIKEGVKRIKDGDIYHRIDIGGKGELAELAANINSITDGLKTAVDSELKSERLKTELITNVSHDIRTPLTSIITYVDLLKTETDSAKVAEYVEVLDQKSKRLKVLTDDLFEAAKASSGSIPVNFERIDITSLITQGLGEVNEKIEALDLDFKVNLPKEKLFVKADGKLLWRSIENLLSNIFKYTLRGSRVYIDIEDLGYEVLLTFKNISAYELNISADELMERFKRGDESRLSQGSGLGLSIAKSLIEAQQGKFVVQVDGDLFKAMIYMPKQKG